jgi:hypothetical protein
MSQHATPPVLCFGPDTVGKVIVPVLATDLSVAAQGCTLGLTEVMERRPPVVEGR